MTTERAAYEMIKAELDAAMQEYEAANQVYDDYNNNPENWNCTNFDARREELYEAIGEKAAKTREIGKRLDAAKKAWYKTTPNSSVWAQISGRKSN